MEACTWVSRGHSRRAISLGWGLSTAALLTFRTELGFVSGGCPTHLQDVWQHPWPFPIDASSRSPVMTLKKVSRCCRHPLVDKTALDSELPWAKSHEDSVGGLSENSSWRRRSSVRFYRLSSSRGVEKARTSGGMDCAGRARVTAEDREVGTRELKGWVEWGRRRVQISPALLTYLCWWFFLCGSHSSWVLVRVTLTA